MTRDQRFSVINLCLPIARVWPTPDGAISQDDRKVWILLYALTSVTTIEFPSLENVRPRVSRHLVY